MADDLQPIAIFFKNPDRTANYLIGSAELARLTQEFVANDSTGRGAGVYAVADPKTHVPRTLVLRFSDVHYIG